MKISSTITVAFVIIISFASCKSGKNINQMLSKSDTRKEVMNTIANSTKMSIEMKEAMFNKENACLIVKEKYDGMGKMMAPEIRTEKYKSDHGINSTKNSTLMVN